MAEREIEFLREGLRRHVHPCRRVLAAVSSNHVAQANQEPQLGWDWPISRSAKEPVAMERSRGGVCRYGGSFPIACRCAAVSSIKLTYYPFGIALQTQSGCALRR